MAGRSIDKRRLESFLRRMSDLLDRPSKIFLLGGSSLTWRGIKSESIDVDLALLENESDPIPILDAITSASDFIEANTDVMRLGDLLPLPEGYAERAEHAADFDRLTVYHFDPYSIALTKLARSATKDLNDIDGMLRAGVIDCATLHHHFESVLERYKRKASRGDWADFQRKVEKFYNEHCE